MHLLETIYQRAWVDANFPDGIVRYLRDIGFLSERLTLAHCIHARPDEIMPVDPIDLLFARGNASLLHDVVVDGRAIVSEGRCLGVDLPAIEKELRAIYRPMPASLAVSSARGRRFRPRFKTGSKRSWIAGNP